MIKRHVFLYRETKGRRKKVQELLRVFLCSMQKYTRAHVEYVLKYILDKKIESKHNII